MKLQLWLVNMVGKPCQMERGVPLLQRLLLGYKVGLVTSSAGTDQGAVSHWKEGESH